MSDDKLFLVFAWNRRIFDDWVQNFHSNSQNRAIRCIYVHELIQVRGVGQSDIVLLRGWDFRNRTEKLQEIAMQIWTGGKIVGVRDQIAEPDWDLFQQLQNEYKYKSQHNFHQDWLFDDMFNRFNLMEI